MKKGYCEKKKEECTEQCFYCKDEYIEAGMDVPCRYLVSPNKGYKGNLTDINGKKLRYQFFLTLAARLFCAAFILILLVGGCVLIHGDNGGYMQAIKAAIVIVGFTVLALLVLSVLNALFFGKVIAVIDEGGIYTNQFFLKWKDIKKVVFHARGHASRYDGFGACSYTEIHTDKKVFKTAHLPISFIYYAKKHGIKSSIKTEKIYLISLIVVIIILLIEFLRSSNL